MPADLKLHSRYKRSEVAEAFDEEYSRGGKWITGVIPLGDNHIALFVTLDKSDYSGEHRYADAFESRTVLRWQSQTRASPDNAWGEKHLDAGPDSLPHHIFVRAEQGDSFLYCGQATCADYEGENPMTIWWELLEPVPPGEYEEFQEATDHAGGLEAPDYVKSRELDLSAPAPDLRDVQTAGQEQRLPSDEGSLYEMEDAAWGWASTWESFVSASREEILESLQNHHKRRFEGLPLSGKQEQAWTRTIHLFQTTLEPLLEEAAGREALITLEYELPGEGGRRPDIVLVTPARDVFVIECKDKLRAQQSDIDQSLRYAQDLKAYHSETRSHSVHPILCLLREEGARPSELDADEVRIEIPEDGTFRDLAESLRSRLQPSEDPYPPERWLGGEYAPLPHLVQAVISTFEGEELPRLKRVGSSNVYDAIRRIEEAAEDAKENDHHILILVTGAPGSGKTLVGVKSVMNTQKNGIDSLYLSGNGPLVAVLQDGLDRAGAEGAAEGVLRDLYKWKQGVTRDLDSHPAHLHVFDEGQRAWERAGDFDGSEIELLIEVAERRDWGVIVGLIGEGQEIYKGEEGGLETWLRELDAGAGNEDWRVLMPERDIGFTSFDHNLEKESSLHLDSSLRSKNADRLHEWVEAVLSGRESHAAGVSFELQKGGFPIHVTESREKAESYVTQLYEGAPDPRYGWVVSSDHSETEEGGGLESEYVHPRNNKQVWGPWFNAPPEDPASCCQLERAASEFNCQGLELDFVLLNWGDDLKRRGDGWIIPSGMRSWSETPEEHTLNAYRVLLTRGREGIVIRCPDDETRNYLRRCGATLLRQ